MTCSTTVVLLEDRWTGLSIKLPTRPEIINLMKGGSTTVRDRVGVVRMGHVAPRGNQLGWNGHKERLLSTLNSYYLNEKKMLTDEPGLTSTSPSDRGGNTEVRKE